MLNDKEELRIDTQLVDVPVAVTDRAGKPVLKLKKENFVVYEDGKPQEIASFFATDEAFEVALLLDTSGSTRSDLRLIKRAARLFLDSLRPGDRVSIIAFNTAEQEDGGAGVTRTYPISEVITGLTENRETLYAALQRVGTSNGTPIYDSLVKVAEEIF
ncbi:MAG: VWA domain-containing protein, partial [Acidobacteriota bacterium]|nr:VWA domain-containing protein [Acidobacteriota bacterium]